MILNLLLLILILIVIVCIILLFFKDNKMNDYLNVNSTYYPYHYKLNPSDIAYVQNEELLSKESYIKDYIKHVVGADDNDIVIFNSGASESIANMMLWAKSLNKYSTVLGSVLDHPSVKTNAENYDLEYEEMSYDDLNGTKDIPDNVSMVFITLLSSKTGEIHPLKFKSYQYKNNFNDIDDDYGNITNQSIKYFKPLKVCDATQAIGKCPINMKKNGFDAVFFSLHKLGGEYNTGVLVVSQDNYKFKPLIAGSQQQHLRGGTYNSYSYADLDKLYSKYHNKFNSDKCKKTWNKITRMFDENEIKYVHPKLKHMYNTILIPFKSCTAELVNKLSELGIFVGSQTACDQIKDNHIRLSWIDPEISDKTINTIMCLVKQYQ